MAMKIIAWVLLLLGVFAAVAGAAQNGADHASYRVNIDYMRQLNGAQAALTAAETARSDAMSAVELATSGVTYAQALSLREAPQNASVTLRELVHANVAVLSAREGMQGLVTAAGTSNLAAAAEQAAEQAVSLPGPLDRITQWLQVGGVWWGVGCVMIAAGAFMARREQALTNAGHGAAEDGVAISYPDTVDHVIGEIEELTALIADLPMDSPSSEVRARIDAIMDEHIAPLVDARGRLIARHGLSRFAIYFGEFSGAERNLARTWSALTDGHSVVARESLAISLASFKRARAGWDEVESAG